MRDVRREERTGEEDRSKVNLEFSEVLHLLSRQAVLGPGVPSR